MTGDALPSTRMDSNEAGSQLRKHAVAVTLICILVAVAYGNSLRLGFAFDDNFIIKRNPSIRHFSYIPTLFTEPYWRGAEIGGLERDRTLYRPMVLTTYTLNYLTTGLETWAFHLTNLLIHLGVALTLYGLGWRLGLCWSGTLVAALMFAVHPLNSEAVTGIVGRAELMMALGVLLACYWDLGKNPPENLATQWSPAALGAFALGMFSKEQAIMLPVLLIVADGMRGNNVVARQWWNILWNARLRYLGYFIVAAVYLVARSAAVATNLPSTGLVTNPLIALDWPLRLINAVKVAGVYLWLTVWPANLSADYSYNAITLTYSPLDPAVWVSALVWILLLALGTVAFFKHRRPLAIGIAIVFLFFLPAANLIVPIGTIMGERLFYLPIAGLCLALGAGWDRVARILAPTARTRWGLAAGLGTAIIILAPLAMRTITRNRDWENNETLFASMVRAQPRSAKARVFLAGAHLKRGELNKALKQYEEALAILPRYKERPTFAKLYGGLLIKLGRIDEAVAIMEAASRTTRFANKDPWIHRKLAIAYEQNKALAKAAASFERAIEISRKVPTTSAATLLGDYNQLARLYALQGRTAKSRQTLETVLELVRKDERLSERRRAGMAGQILGNLALTDKLEGKYAQAEQRYLAALELLESPDLEDPQLLIARLRDYARLLRKLGRKDEAVAIDHRAASLESNFSIR